MKDQHALLRSLNANLDIKRSRERLVALAPVIATALRVKLEAQQAQRNEAEAVKQVGLQLIARGIEGKNEREREANLAGVKARDVEYQSHAEFLEEVTARLIDADVQLESLIREWTALTINQRQATAIIQFLAGDETEKE